MRVSSAANASIVALLGSSRTIHYMDPKAVKKSSLHAAHANPLKLIANASVSWWFPSARVGNVWMLRA